MIGRPLLIHLCLVNMKKIRTSVHGIRGILSEDRERSDDELMPDAPDIEPDVTILPRMPAQEETTDLRFPEPSASGHKRQIKDLTPNRVTPDTSGLSIAERHKARYVREKGVYKPKRNSIGTKGKRKPLKPMAIRPRQVMKSPVKQPKGKQDQLKARIADKQAQAKLNLKNKKRSVM